MNFISELENHVVNKYGFENPKTILTFRITNLLRWNHLYHYDISDVPFVPDIIDGHPVLCVHGNTAICG